MRNIYHAVRIQIAAVFAFPTLFVVPIRLFSNDVHKHICQEVTAEIQEKQTASANVGTFLNAFKQIPDSLTEFSLESWHSMVGLATAYSIDDIRFTFKNGQKIQA